MSTLLRRRAAAPHESNMLDADGAPLPIGTHAAYADAADRLGALERALHLAQVQEEALVSRRDLRARGADVSNSSSRDQAQRDRLARLDAELAKGLLPAPTLGPSDTPAVIERALALLGGAAIDPPETVEQQLDRVRKNIAILGAAVGAQRAIVDDMRAQLSADVATALAPRHHDILRTILEAARGLAAALAAERELFAAPLVAGFDAAPHILVRPWLPGGADLGQERDFNSQLYAFRKSLENRGIV